MKKNAILKVIRIALSLVTVFCIICAVTVKGRGLLDFSDIVRVVCICIAVVCGILAIILFKAFKPKN